MRYKSTIDIKPHVPAARLRELVSELHAFDCNVRHDAGHEVLEFDVSARDMIWITCWSPNFAEVPEQDNGLSRPSLPK